MRAKARMFRVIMEVPEGATIEDCKNYIHEAVAYWGAGSRPPGSLDVDDLGDPFFGLDRDAISVTQLCESS